MKNKPSWIRSDRGELGNSFSDTIDDYMVLAVKKGKNITEFRKDPIPLVLTPSERRQYDCDGIYLPALGDLLQLKRGTFRKINTIRRAWELPELSRKKMQEN